MIQYNRYRNEVCKLNKIEMKPTTENVINIYF